jgi:hypothetical protein
VGKAGETNIGGDGSPSRPTSLDGRLGEPSPPKQVARQRPSIINSEFFGEGFEVGAADR